MLRFEARLPSFEKQNLEALYPFQGITAQLLYSRGITTAESAYAFMNPDISQLHNPLLLHDMDKVLSILSEAKEQEWPTLVYGDYDADGICSTTIMTEALTAYGINATPHIPLRAEGYGLNVEAIHRYSKDFKLLVTVDLGITNHEEVRLAQSLGMVVIVTDHHALALEHSPANAVVNPLLGDYPNRKLCGAGVAFKVAEALLGLENIEPFWEIAALATVCDMVTLIDENRLIASVGIEKMMHSKRLGMQALLQISGVTDVIDSDTLGFRLGPRLNAAGRLGDANDAVALMLSTTPETAQHYAEKLDSLNSERKKLENELINEAEKQVENYDFVANPALIISGKDWPAGIVGLVAGRLCLRFSCPVCVLSEHDGMMHGSLRSVKGVHIQKCLQALDPLLHRYGGHELAAGVTLFSENFNEFFDGMQALIRKADPQCFLPVHYFDAKLSLSQCTRPLWQELCKMSPFGTGNPLPYFLSENVQLEERRAVGSEGSHLKLTLREDSHMLSGIAFSKGELASVLPERVDVIYSLNENTFRGVSNIQALVTAIRPVPQSELQSLQIKDPLLEETSLLQSISYFHEHKNTNSLPETKMQTFEDMADCLKNHSRGVLLLAHTKKSASTAFNLDGLTLCNHVINDPRCFNTLLCFPQFSSIQGHWSDIWLLDGVICEDELCWLKKACPQATIHVLTHSDSLRLIATRIDAGDEAYRRLYRCLAGRVLTNLHSISQICQLTPSQTLVGLQAFHDLQLISLSLSPFHYKVLPAQKCDLNDSYTLSCIRKLTKEILNVK